MNPPFPIYRPVCFSGQSRTCTSPFQLFPEVVSTIRRLLIFKFSESVLLGNGSWAWVCGMGRASLDGRSLELRKAVVIMSWLDAHADSVNAACEKEKNVFFFFAVQGGNVLRHHDQQAPLVDLSCLFDHCVEKDGETAEEKEGEEALRVWRGFMRSRWVGLWFVRQWEGICCNIRFPYRAAKIANSSYFYILLLF